jgi:hypothetical protein
VFVPEYLYQLTDRDQRLTWLDPVLFFERISGLLATIDVTFTVPDGRLVILQHAFLNLTPGAGITAQQKVLELLPPGAAQLPKPCLIRSDVNSGAGVTGQFNWQGSIAVPSLWRVHANCTFSGIGAINGVELSLIGALIPIGNVQRV